MRSKSRQGRTEWVLKSTAPYDGPIEGADELRLAESVERIAPALNESWESRRHELEAQIAAARLTVRNT